jgi:Uncharacterized conserved protein (DUF2304)
MSSQALLVMVAAAALMLSTFALVRRRLLSVRYGLGWLAVSLIGFVGAPLLSVLSAHVDELGFTQTGFSLGLFVGFLGLVCLQLSISLSGLHSAMQDLAEHAALVEERLRAVELRTAEDPEAATAAAHRQLGKTV